MYRYIGPRSYLPYWASALKRLCTSMQGCVSRSLDGTFIAVVCSLSLLFDECCFSFQSHTLLLLPPASKGFSIIVEDLLQNVADPYETNKVISHTHMHTYTHTHTHTHVHITQCHTWSMLSYMCMYRKN